jgi:hypothetical protein
MRFGKHDGLISSRPGRARLADGVRRWASVLQVLFVTRSRQLADLAKSLTPVAAFQLTLAMRQCAGQQFAKSFD